MTLTMPERSLAAAILALIAWAAAPPLHAQEPKGATSELNHPFESPDVARFTERFEAESREVFARRGEIVAWLDLRPGMAVADIGAGTGAFTVPIARAVGAEGTVFAVDISPGFVRHVAERTEKEGLGQVVPVVCTQRSARLPAASVDLVFLCDTYHHFEHPAETLASIRKALRPGGSLVLIEYDRHEGATDFVKGHIRGTKADFTREIEEAGFESVEVPAIPGLTENFVARFRVVGGPAGHGGGTR